MTHLRQFWTWLVQPTHLFVVLLATVPLFVLLGFIDAGARNIPRFDQYRAFHIAVAAADGTLHPADFFRPAHGHVTVFTFILTALNTWLTDWNLRTEAYLNVVLALVNYTLFLVLFWRTAREYMVWVLVPFSMLVFSVQQDFNWIIPYDIVWHLTTLWFLVVVVVLAYNPGRWWALVVGMLLSLLSTFSHGNGFMAWGGGLLYLLLVRPRRWQQIVTWVVVAVPTVAFFLWVSLPTINQDLTEIVVVTAPLWVRLWDYAVFMIAFQGAVFVSLFGGYPLAAWLGLAGLLLLGGSAGYLAWRRVWGALQLWLPVAAYGLAIGVMVAVTRLDQHGPERIFLTWYTTPAITFWVAVIALMVVVLGEVRRPGALRWERGLTYVGVIAAVYFGGRYVVANYNDLNYPYSVDVVHMQREDCYMRYIFRQHQHFDETCIFPDYVYDLNQLAARRLSVYSSRPTESILTDDSDPSQLVLVETADPWINYHLQNYFLDDVDPTRIHHVYTDVAPLADLPQPFVNGHAADDADTLLETLRETDVFWYITREEHATAMPQVWETLRVADYAEVNVVARNEGFVVSEIVAVPPALADSPRFGDGIQLRAVTSVSETVEPCGILSLESFWETETPLGLEYSANLVLVDATGNGVVTSDARLSTVGTNRWQPGSIYYDSRELGVPCGLAPGNYDLLFGIYYYQAPDDKLPVAQIRSDRTDLAYISMITVVESTEAAQ